MKPCNSGIFFDTRTDIAFFGSFLITHNYQQILEHVLLYYVRFRFNCMREREREREREVYNESLRHVSRVRKLALTLSTLSPLRLT